MRMRGKFSTKGGFKLKMVGKRMGGNNKILLKIHREEKGVELKSGGGK